MGSVVTTSAALRMDLHPTQPSTVLQCLHLHQLLQLLLLHQHLPQLLDLLTTAHLLASLMRLLMSSGMKMALTSVPSAMPNAALMLTAQLTLQGALPSLDASSRIPTLVTRHAALSAASLVDLAQMALPAAVLWLACATGLVPLPTASASRSRRISLSECCDTTS